MALQRSKHSRINASRGARGPGLLDASRLGGQTRMWVFGLKDSEIGFLGQGEGGRELRGPRGAWGWRWGRGGRLRRLQRVPATRSWRVHGALECNV